MQFLTKHGIWFSLLIAVLLAFYMRFAGGQAGATFSVTGAVFYFFGAYFTGAVPFGVLISKSFGLGDPRKIGSGNIGATNVLRSGNKTAAALTLIFDALKGFIPVMLARDVSPEYAGFALLGALVGHCFPIWLRFKGGKGVATYIGGVIGVGWIFGAIAGAIWLAMALISRVSSLSALFMVCLMPMVVFVRGHESLMLWLGLSAILIVYQHRANITRIKAGTEPKIGKK